MAFGTGEKSIIYYVILGNLKYAFRAKKVLMTESAQRWVY